MTYKITASGNTKTILLDISAENIDSIEFSGKYTVKRKKNEVVVEKKAEGYKDTNVKVSAVILKNDDGSIDIELIAFKVKTIDEGLKLIALLGKKLADNEEKVIKIIGIVEKHLDSMSSN